MVPGKNGIIRIFARGQRGLRWEILVSLGLLMLGAVAFMGTTALKSAERAIILQNVESLTRVTKVIQAMIGEQVELEGDIPIRSRMLFRDLTPSAGIDGFAISDNRAIVIAHSRDEEVGKKTADPYLLKALKVRRLVTPNEVPIQGQPPGQAMDLFFKPLRTWTFAAPVLAGGRLVGAFSVKYQLEGMLVTLRVHRRIVFSIALIDSLVILVFGIWLIGRTAIDPILRISRGAQAFAAGHYDTRVEVKGPREISVLAESFNRMADEVQKSVRKQDEHLQALESVNTELIATQVEMLRVEKLASVGRLSAGIAHEIGNPLSAILGYTSILLREDPDPEAAQYLGYIEKETERIQRIISGLLEFSRPRETRIETLDVNDLIRTTLELISPQELLKNVQMDLDLSDNLPPIQGDRYQLQQVLINILLNGAQAMDGEGELSVVSYERRLERGEVPRRRATDSEEADYATMRRRSDDFPLLHAGGKVVTVSVRDTGHGIPEKIAVRIFDPFFTTKDPGEGTGLGLSIAFGIVQAHGGKLRVRSVEGEGTEVAVDLPVVD